MVNTGSGGFLMEYDYSGSDFNRNRLSQSLGCCLNESLTAVRASLSSVM